MKGYSRAVVIGLALGPFCGCSSEDDSGAPPAPTPPPAGGGGGFVDITAEAGVGFTHVNGVTGDLLLGEPYRGENVP